MQPHKFIYYRNLPHLQPGAAFYFVTYRLYNSVPITKINELKEAHLRMKLQAKEATEEEIYRNQARYFLQFDQCLDTALNEPYHLKNPNIATVVADSLHFNNNKHYHLHSFTIMPNHVHVLLNTFEHSPPLYALLQKHKRFTAWQGNKILRRSGCFWNHESYDHVVRNADSYYRIVHYILNNPVKANLAKHWKEWPWTYLMPELEQELW